MPNHVNNVLKIDGPSAREAIGKYYRTLTDPDNDKPYETFDFNTLIPMPDACSRIVENGVSENVLAIITHSAGMVASWEHLSRHDTGENMGRWKGLFGYEPGEIEARLERRYPGCIEAARMMARCIAETGHKSWYEWSIANWGTKWNAYQASISGEGNATELRFQTAWGVPTPILNALAAAEPALSFQYWAFDEGWNFYATGSGRGGRIDIEVRRRLDRNDPRVIEVYRICYGEDPEFDDEDAA